MTTPAPTPSSTTNPPARPAPQRILLTALAGLLALTIPAATPTALAAQSTRANQPATTASTTTVRAYANNARDFVGTPIPFNIDITNATSTPDPPDLTGINPNLNIQYLGSEQSTSTSITTINGRRVQQSTSTTTLRYAATPLRPGQHIIPPIELTIDNNTYTTRPVAIEALAPEQRADMTASIELDTTTAFVGQPITLSLHIDALPELLAIPTILSPDSIDHLRILPLPEGITSTNPSAARQRTQEEQVNIQVRQNQAAPAVGSLLSTDAYLRRSPTTIAERPAQRWTLRVAAIPTRAGTITIPPITVRAQIEVATRRDVFGRPVAQPGITLLETQPITLSALPVPPDPNPQSTSPWLRDDNLPLVGRFNLAARATPQTINVGDPIELAIAITGWQPLDRLARLDLTAAEGLDNRFRLPPEPITPQATHPNLIFNAQIRAADERITHIPPITLRAFDPIEEQWRTIESEPIPLDVRATRVVRAGDVIDPQSLRTDDALQATADTNSFAPIDIDPAILNQRAVTLTTIITSPAIITAIAAPPAVCLASLITIAAIRTRRNRPTTRSPRAALKHALAHLDNLQRTPPPTLPETADQLTHILRQYLADRAPTEPPPQIRDILNTCDAIRFAPDTTPATTTTPTDLINRTRDALTTSA